MVLQVPHRKSLTEAVFKEPLSELTMKIRRDLLFVASFAILLTVYDLKVNKTPWLDIEVPENAPNILHGAISAALVYFFLVFIFYAWEDFRRWRHADAMLHLHSYFDLTLHGRDSLHAIAQHLDKLPLEQKEDKRTKAIGEVIDKSTTFFDEVEGKVRDIYIDHQVLGVIQWGRLLILDFGIPILLGVIALYKISPALWPFISAIFR